ncbi:YggS family pyridoxal phosphate-dependent enzyme [Marinactinospora rubrisoli]|uniref:Pyridoxal phosphate homeostasis protein n=1 Tax=Marinactinospora rubrisoli TaxID=2715399 RepID=A0ABW2KM38_9ACTN
MTGPEAERSRAGCIAANLATLRSRIAAACEAVGRRVDEVAVIAVTKTYPASDVRILTNLGIRDVGENRDQEAAPKAAECADLALRWHFVGQLQTNKVRSVVRYADVVHSVDRERLARELGTRARAVGREISCLVQVNLDPESAAGVLGPRGGADPRDVLSVADAVHAEEGLAVGGVMAVAPRGGDPAEAFGRLAEVAAQVRARYPQATVVSAGMSGDLEAAIASGATHLRIGTALLGDRAANVG